jgi:hypothetical protein
LDWLLRDVLVFRQPLIFVGATFFGGPEVGLKVFASPIVTKVIRQPDQERCATLE